MQAGGPSPDAYTLQRQRLQTLNEISRVVSSTLDLGELYDTIYSQISRVTDASQFFIGLHQPGDLVIDVPYLREEGELSVDQTTEYGNNATSLVIDSGISFSYGTADEWLKVARRHGWEEGLVGEKESESGIFVPLNTGSRTIGALTVQTTRPHAYTDEDVGMLSVIASQAAVAIENARLYQQSRESVRHFEALLHVAESVNSSLDLHAVLDAILTGIRDVVPFYLASVLLPDATGQNLQIVGSVGPLSDHWRDTVKIPMHTGITGRVFCTGEALLVADVREHPAYVSDGSGEVRSELAVPLRRGDTVVGVLNLERTEVDGFSRQDSDLLLLFASQAAIAIENARLFRELERRVSDLQTIQTIVQKLTPIHDVTGVANVINTELKRLIDYHSWRLYAVDSHQETLIPISIEGPAAGGVLHVGEGMTGWIAEHGEPVLIDNLQEEARAKFIAGTPDRPESMIGAPLIFEDRVQGVITLSRLGAKQFDRNSLRLLTIVAAQMAIAFDRARLYGELRAEAITDPLTGLYNRRYLSERFGEERSRAVRNRHTLAAMMVDIDKFKLVNDSYGHDAGDQVLEELARIIRAVVRAEDIVARYGGEEFCILLPEISPDHALQLGDRLRRTIETHAMPLAAGTRPITVSIGIALLAPDNLSEEIFHRADQAMYRVKRAGGNRVCLDDDDQIVLVP